jgi:hypothetical protein
LRTRRGVLGESPRSPIQRNETIIRKQAHHASYLRLRPPPRGTNVVRWGFTERLVLAGAIASCGMTPMPKIVRHGLIAFGSALWFAGLWAQFHSLAATATYVMLSLLMVLIVGL